MRKEDVHYVESMLNSCAEERTFSLRFKGIVDTNKESNGIAKTTWKAIYIGTEFGMDLKEIIPVKSLLLINMQK